jgi:hypothetical protein
VGRDAEPIVLLTDRITQVENLPGGLCTVRVRADRLPRHVRAQVEWTRSNSEEVHVWPVELDERGDGTAFLPTRHEDLAMVVSAPGFQPAREDLPRRYRNASAMLFVRLQPLPTYESVAPLVDDGFPTDSRHTVRVRLTGEGAGEVDVAGFRVEALEGSTPVRNVLAAANDGVFHVPASDGGRRRVRVRPSGSFLHGGTGFWQDAVFETDATSDHGPIDVPIAKGGRLVVVVPGDAPSAVRVFDEAGDPVVVTFRAVDQDGATAELAPTSTGTWLVDPVLAPGRYTVGVERDDAPTERHEALLEAGKTTEVTPR